MSAAAFRATFADFRLVKGRKVGQMIFEVPLEEADAALGAMGGLPKPDGSVWVGIARIDPKAIVEEPKPSEPSERKKQKWRETRPSQQAGMRSQNPTFSKFLNDVFGYACETGEDAADAIREICGVKSRADILDGTSAASKWRKLDDQYQAWLQT